jgi:hypothetical protein
MEKATILQIPRTLINAVTVAGETGATQTKNVIKDEAK